MHNVRLADSQGKNSARQAEPSRDDGLEVCPSIQVPSYIPFIELDYQAVKLAEDIVLLEYQETSSFCRIKNRLLAITRLAYCDAIHDATYRGHLLFVGAAKLDTSRMLADLKSHRGDYFSPCSCTRCINQRETLRLAGVFVPIFRQAVLA